MEFYTYSRENINSESSTCDDKRLYLEITRRASNSVNEIFVYMHRMFTVTFRCVCFRKFFALSTGWHLQ